MSNLPSDATKWSGEEPQYCWQLTVAPLSTNNWTRCELPEFTAVKKKVYFKQNISCLFSLALKVFTTR